MKLIELQEQDKGRYNQFVAASDSGSFLQSWEWGGWQKFSGREVHRFFIVDGNTTIGSIQIIQMPLLFGKYYLYAPHGPVISGKWGVNSGQLDFFIDEIKLKFPKAIFIRIEPKEKSLPTNHYPLITKTKNIQPGKTLLIDLSKPEDQLLAEMHQKTRYNIKVAQRHNVQIQKEFGITVGHGLFFKEALELVVKTSGRQGFKSYGYDYYKNLIDFISIKNAGCEIKAHLYKAVLGSRLLASGIYLDFGKIRTYLFGGSSENQKNVMAPYLLHFQAMLDAKANNIEFYDFWGTETAGGKVPGFVRFKLGFGGQEIVYAGAYDCVVKSGEYYAYRAFRKLNKLIR